MVSLASQRGEGIWCASILLGVDGAVSVRVQSGTNMKNSESWEKAHEKSWIVAFEAIIL